MSTAKVSTYRAPDTIIEKKNGQLGIEGHGSLDNFIIQAIGKEPFLSFSRPGESPAQWIQLLHALDKQENIKRGLQLDAVEENSIQQGNFNGFNSVASVGIKEPGNLDKSPKKVTRNTSEQLQTLKIPEAVVAFAQAAAKANGEHEKYLPGWPLLSPTKIQLQKCEKCSKEFCSPINYRRHVRVHRRSLNTNKVSPKNRELLHAFWDKLSLDEAKELASIKDVSLEEVSGCSIIRALTSLMRKPGFYPLPHVYLKSGAVLLDVVECRSSTFPISSQELFGVLDDASENTFLCGGMAISLQKFVFDGDVEKIAMDMKNLIACTSFLLEQKLVEAWLADKDAEALRWQKLLFEEEEAAQKRQADLLERKRMKKLRQKEQKVKEQVLNKCSFENGSHDAVGGISESANELCSASPLEAERSLQTIDLLLCSTNLVLEDTQPSAGVSYPEDEHDLEDRTQQDSAQGHPSLSHQSLVRRGKVRHGHGSFHSQPALTKPVFGQKPCLLKDLRPNPPVANGQMVWTRKSRSEDEKEDVNCQQFEIERATRCGGTESSKVLIGSISVSLKDCYNLDHDHDSLRQSSTHERLVRTNSSLHDVNQTSDKLHVVSQVSGYPENDQRESRETDVVEPSDLSSVRVLPDNSCLADSREGDCRSDMTQNSNVVLERAWLSVPKLFSTKDATVFLSHRWRQALSSDHVKVVPPDADDLNVLEEPCADVPDAGAEVEAVEATSMAACKPSGKCYTLKYIPKES